MTNSTKYRKVDGVNLKIVLEDMGITSETIASNLNHIIESSNKEENLENYTRLITEKLKDIVYTFQDDNRKKL